MVPTKMTMDMHMFGTMYANFKQMDIDGYG